MDKDIKNEDAITRKLWPALTRIINYKLKVTSEEKRKKEEIVERRKTKAKTTKRQRARGGISLSSE